jgi:hypothetical protein
MGTIIESLDDGGIRFSIGCGCEDKVPGCTHESEEIIVPADRAHDAFDFWVEAGVAFVALEDGVLPD